MEQKQVKSGKYIQIWKNYLPTIISAIKCAPSTIKLERSLFESAGDREKSGYSFRLDIHNGIIPEKSGTAVARDLKKILDESTEFKLLSKEKYIVIRLSKNFELEVKPNNSEEQ